MATRVLHCCLLDAAVSILSSTIYHQSLRVNAPRVAKQGIALTQASSFLSHTIAQKSFDLSASACLNQLHLLVSPAMLDHQPPAQTCEGAWTGCRGLQVLHNCINTIRFEAFSRGMLVCTIQAS